MGAIKNKWIEKAPKKKKIDKNSFEDKPKETNKFLARTPFTSTLRGVRK